MKTINKFTTTAAFLLLALIMPVIGSLGQAPCISADQARMILSKYIQKPDTVLTRAISLSINPSGHIDYTFEGDGYGRYCIDGTSLAKIIIYAGFPEIKKPGAAPAKLLSVKTLRDIAAKFVAHHFPGYINGMFTIRSFDNLDDVDMNNFDIDFEINVASGAKIPTSCSISIDDETGYITQYDEYPYRININCNPRLSLDQAMAAGRAWLAENITSAPEAGELLDRDQYSAQLRVIVDTFLNQALVYEIYFRAMVLDIEANSGQVIGTDLYMSLSTFKGAPKSSLSRRETLLGIHPAGVSAVLNRRAVKIDGCVYIPVEYLKYYGCACVINAKNVICKYGKTAKQTVSIVSRPTKGYCYKRGGDIYFPLAMLAKNGAVVKEDEHGDIALPGKKVKGL